MKCKHKIRCTMTAIWIADGVITSAPTFRVAGMQTFAQVPVNNCRDCHEWLSLGPANDTDPRVAVEKRAAELNVTGYSCADDHALEWAGRRHYIEGHEFPTSLGGQCGWLAQVINEHATHDQEEG